MAQDAAGPILTDRMEKPITGPRPLKVETPVFEGPLELLLALAEREEVDIFQVSLARVTDAYLAEIAQLETPDPKEMAKVEEEITSVMEQLAQQIARDGEGATKFITIVVSGAPSHDGAARMARAIANSPLVKTAMAGSDPNWGRILSAAGNAGVAFDPLRTDVHLQGVLVCRQGLAAPFSEPELKQKLDAAECEIRVTVRGKGKGAARFWTCDLTEGYIRINANYRT